LWSGAAARQFEAYFARKVGFRSEVVRSVNQFNFSVLGKISGNMGTPVILGKDHWLYEHEYVRHYVRELGVNDRDRSDFVSSLKRFQDALKARGIAFVLVISPSKPEIYPEHLPDQYRNRVVRDTPTRAYGMLRPEFEAAGVNVFDVHRFFKDAKPKSELLFAKTGTHWNYYGSFLACRQMLWELRDNQGLQLALPQLERIVMDSTVGTDEDLLQLLNLLWFEFSEKSQTPYPIVSTDPVEMELRPNVLVVGDSFSFTLIDALNLSKSVREIDLLYYFKRHFRYPVEDKEGYVQDHEGAEIGPIDYNNLDWKRLLLDKDLVILEINEIMFIARGWGFLDRATEVAK